jgi:hypothetical protein
MKDKSRKNDEMKDERFFPNGPRKLSGPLRKTPAAERGILMPK